MEYINEYLPEDIAVLSCEVGKEKAMGFLVGRTMKAMKGKADPAMVNKLVNELLAGKDV